MSTEFAVTRKPSKESQAVCIDCLNEQFDDPDYYDGCDPFETIEHEFESLAYSNPEGIFLDLGLNRIVTMIQNCQNGCTAIALAKKTNSPVANNLVCNRALGTLYKMIDRELSIENFITEEDII